MRFLALAILLLLAAGLSLSIGQVNLGVSALWSGLTGADDIAGLTVRFLRAPRVLVGILAGAAFGLSGGILQSLFRNPLASPDLMGFSSGSGLAILLVIAWGIAMPIPLAAALGGLLTSLLVFLLARPKGSHRLGGQDISTVMLVLVGIGVGFTAASLGSFLMTRLSGPEAAEAQRWLAGSLSARDWAEVIQLSVLLSGLVLLLALQIRRLRALELGVDLAAGLGIPVERARLLLSMTAVGLAASAVAVVGPIAFVALMAPPIGARLTKVNDPAARLVAAALVGAIIVVLADLVARAAMNGVQLPIGVMTGVLGAPYLLWLLSREMKRGEL